MKKISTQKKQIIILLVLLVIICYANYQNYYVSRLPDDKITDLSSMSEKQKMNLIKKTELALKEKFENIKNSQNETNSEVYNTNDEQNNFDIKPIDSKKIDNKNNYIQNAVNINGELSVWNKKSISVYIQPNSVYKKTAADAFNLYNKIYKNYFELYPAKTKDNADIMVLFVNALSPGEIKESNMCGVTSIYTDKNGYIDSAVIKLLTVNQKTHKAYTAKDIYPVILHEIGHAMGIVGHSSDSADIMYQSVTSNSPILTVRDRNTLKMMYSKHSQQIKDNVEELAEAKMVEAKKYSEINSNETLSWINLGKTYYSNGDKEKSMDSFKKAIAIDAKNPEIYIAMGDCYYSSKKYQTAIKNYTKAYELSKDSNQKVEIRVLIGIAYIKMNDFENAYNHFSEAHKFKKSDKKILYNLIVSCVNTNRKAETVIYIEEYRKLGVEDSKISMINEAYDWATR